MYYIWTLKVNI